jgi:hypothetical protein
MLDLLTLAAMPASSKPCLTAFRAWKMDLSFAQVDAREDFWTTAPRQLCFIGR